MTESEEELNSMIRDIKISKIILKDYKNVVESHTGYRSLLNQISTALNRTNHITKLGDEKLAENLERARKHPSYYLTEWKRGKEIGLGTLVRYGHEIQDSEIRYHLMILRARCEIGIKDYGKAARTFYDIYYTSNKEEFLELHEYLENPPSLRIFRKNLGGITELLEKSENLHQLSKNYQGIRHRIIKKKIGGLFKDSVKGLEEKIKELKIESAEIKERKKAEQDKAKLHHPTQPQEQRIYSSTSVA